MSGVPLHHVRVSPDYVGMKEVVTMGPRRRIRWGWVVASLLAAFFGATLWMAVWP